MTVMNYRMSIAVPLLALMACSASEQERAEESSRLGEADARKLIEESESMTIMQMEGAIVQIRANEYAYREAGHDKAADAYVASFESYMRENADSLANIIFN